MAETNQTPLWLDRDLLREISERPIYADEIELKKSEHVSRYDTI